MEEWQSALLVAAIAAIAGLLGAIIGKERWPADLRDAKRLGEIIDKMVEGTKEREFAETYRDDLASRWLISRVVARNDFRRELGLVLMIVGTVFVATSSFVLVAAALGQLRGAPGQMIVAAATWFVSGLLLVGGGTWLGNAYLKRWNEYLTQLRAARGMRAPISDWVREFDRSYRHAPIAPAAPGDAPGEDQHK
jgi:hypothetical protein